MPDSVATVLVLVFAMFPGFIGNRVYESFVGLDWREREWRTVLRLIGLSVTGAVLYSASARSFGLNPPIHLFPSTFQELMPDSPLVPEVAVSYLGHLVGSAVAGAIAILSERVMAQFSSRSMYPGAWDDFARAYAPRHWVVVGLNNGEVYAGILKNVDVAVATEDRDLVLEEPCAYDAKTGEYTAVSYQHLFVPAAMWYSIAVIHDATHAPRKVPVGEPLFSNRGESK